MTEDSPPDQDAFLNTMRTERARISVFLVNGIRLVGNIESFDQHMVLLSSATGMQLVYKHAISTVQPDAERARPIRTESSESLASTDRGNKQTVVVARKRRFATTEGDS